MLRVVEPVLAACGVSFQQYLILLWVRDGVVVNPRDIRDQYGHDSGALTRVIDQLAERGFLERVRRNRDRRKVELKLTNGGRAAIDGLIPIVVAKQNAVLMEFGVAEMREFHRLLVKLDEGLSTLLRE